MITFARSRSTVATSRRPSVRVRALLLFSIALIATPAPAWAHAHLTGAKPAAGARLTVAPRELVLTFSEAPALAMSTLQLFGPDSTPVALGAPNHGAGVRTLSVTINGQLAPIVRPDPCR